MIPFLGFVQVSNAMLNEGTFMEESFCLSVNIEVNMLISYH